MSRSKRYSPEIRQRAVRMVLSLEGEQASRWAAIQSISEKIGCTAAPLFVSMPRQDITTTRYFRPTATGSCSC